MHGHAQQRTQHPRQNSLDMVKPAKSVLKGSPLASLLTSPNSADTSDNSPQPLHPHSVSPLHWSRIPTSCSVCWCRERRVHTCYPSEIWILDMFPEHVLFAQFSSMYCLWAGWADMYSVGNLYSAWTCDGTSCVGHIVRWWGWQVLCELEVSWHIDVSSVLKWCLPSWITSSVFQVQTFGLNYDITFRQSDRLDRYADMAKKIGTKTDNGYVINIFSTYFFNSKIIF